MLPKVNVVIPTIGKDRMVIDLLQQLEEQDEDILGHIFVMDNGMPEQTKKDCYMFRHVKVIDSPGASIYHMWNKGVKLSLGVNQCDYIAIFNDDLILNTDNFLTRLVEPLDLHEEVWAACANYSGPSRGDEDSYMEEVTGTFKDQGFAGFCFAVKGEAFVGGLPLFEERYHWWFGDDDFVHAVHKMGHKTVMATQAWMIHIDNGSNTIVQYTPEFNEKVARDQEIYVAKWHTH